MFTLDLLLQLFFFFFIANRCQSTSKYDHLLTDPYCIYRVWSCGALSIHTCSITCSDTKKASHPGPGHTVERQTSIHTRSHLQITNSECIRSTFFFLVPFLVGDQRDECSKSMTRDWLETLESLEGLKAPIREYTSTSEQAPHDRWGLGGVV